MQNHKVEISSDLLLEHASFLRGVARTLIWDQDRVDDIVQDAMVAALESPPREVGALRSWLGKVVRNLALMELRKTPNRVKREKAVAKDEDLPATSELVERHDLLANVIDQVKSLPEPYFTTIHLRYYEGLPPAEMARRLGISVNTVKFRLKKAKEMLRSSLDRKFNGDRRAWCLALAPFAGMPGTCTGLVLAALLSAAMQPKVMAVAGVLLLVAMAFPVYSYLTGNAEADAGLNQVVAAEDSPIKAPVVAGKESPGLGKRKLLPMAGNPALAMAGVSLGGQVIDAITGRPVGGAKILVRFNSNNLVLPGTQSLDPQTLDKQVVGCAGDDGGFLVDRLIENSTLLLDITAEGYVDNRQNYINVGFGTTNLGRILLSPYQQAKVFVTNAGGEPIAGAMVKPLRCRGGVVRGRAITRTRGAKNLAYAVSLDGLGWSTDATGRVNLGKLQSGVYKFRVHAHGYKSIVSDLTVVTPGKNETINLKMEPGSDLLIQVWNPEMKPEKDVQIYVMSRNREKHIPTRKARTDSEGKAWLGSYPADCPLMVMARGKGNMRQMMLESVPLGRLDVVLNKPLQRRGNQVKATFVWPQNIGQDRKFRLCAVQHNEGGRDVAGQKMIRQRMISLVHEITPKVSEFMLDCNNEGNARLVLFSEDYGFCQSPRFKLDFKVPQAVVVKVPDNNRTVIKMGQVVDGQGNPVAGAMVLVNVSRETCPWPPPLKAEGDKKAWFSLSRVRTNGDGLFRVSLPDDIPCRLQAVHQAKGMAWFDLASPAMDSADDCRIVLQNSGVIRGQVTGFNARAHKSVLVQLRDSQSSLSLATSVDGKGSFVFNNLPPGNYRLRADYPSYMAGMGSVIQFQREQKVLQTHGGTVVALSAGKTESVLVPFPLSELFGELDLRISGLAADHYVLTLLQPGATAPEVNISDQRGVYQMLLVGGIPVALSAIPAGEYRLEISKEAGGSPLARRKINVVPGCLNEFHWTVKLAQVHLDLGQNKFSTVALVARKAGTGELQRNGIYRARPGGDGVWFIPRVPYGSYSLRTTTAAKPTIREATIKVDSPRLFYSPPQ